MSLQLVKIGDANDSVLRTRAVEIPKVDKEIRKHIFSMDWIVREHKALGLAANQVGLGIRLILVRLDGRITPMVNPVFEWKSKEKYEDDEGCLSIPGKRFWVPRHLAVGLKYTDQDGRDKNVELYELNARIVQHEIDHLDGIMISDYESLVMEK